MIQVISDESKADAIDGIDYEVLTFGKYKDMGAGYEALTAEERRIMQATIDTMGELMVDKIAYYRGMDRDAVAKLATGRSYLGVTAIENGLIDELGDMKGAENWINSQIAADAYWSPCNLTDIWEDRYGYAE